MVQKSNYYNNIAHIYDETRWLTAAIAEDVINYILKLVNATPDTSFLEPGVGTGLNVFPLVKLGYPVTGVDISESMLNQFRYKFQEIPDNLTLIQTDASLLPFPNQSFDVVITCHMIHAVHNWQEFLNQVMQITKIGGFYLNCQWLTPLARLEFENHFRAILAKYQPFSRQQSPNSITEINVDAYLQSQGYQGNYSIAKKWLVTNTVEELLRCLKLRAYGLCWQISDNIFEQVITEFEKFCIQQYGSLETVLASEAKFEIWMYTKCNNTIN
ncbi:class I SAM-dependent methyltransferase [Calothrix sp. PCC 6303]|uniref:class I SAM-dependent methyltransferase n=1 Tax=Calothrix sp. PCC 6303 TaxID=1170562 RepID=UPI0002A01C3B|nr:class I SAM-dependent methyltransferase [Calothrix sp. PCC 6303]AFZ02675.1 Methyltransferase type 11 [Calothrix sp. PCC 6303]